MTQSTTVGGASPFQFPTIWDSLSLGGGAFTWDGRVDFKGARRNFDWQFKKPPGVKGDINTFRGTHAHPFEMIVWVWTDAQWRLLPDLLAFFEYDGTKIGPDGNPLVSPIDIYHPALSFLNIGQVLCEWIEAPDVDKERSGDVKIRFGLHEYLPAIPTKNVTTTPTGTTVPTVFAVNFVNPPAQSTTGQIINSQNRIDNLAGDLGKPGALP